MQNLENCKNELFESFTKDKNLIQADVLASLRHRESTTPSQGVKSRLSRFTADRKR